MLQCAASMNVCVGSFSDPKGLEGLAHFLGELLFFKQSLFVVGDDVVVGVDFLDLLSFVFVIVLIS